MWENHEMQMRWESPLCGLLLHMPEMPKAADAI